MKSSIVTLKVPSFKESLRNLEKTRRRPSFAPPTPVEIGTFAKGSKPLNFKTGQSAKYTTSDSSRHQGSIQGSGLMSKNRYIAWLLEDPDPDPPRPYQGMQPC